MRVECVCVCDESGVWGERGACGEGGDSSSRLGTINDHPLSPCREPRRHASECHRPIEIIRVEKIVSFRTNKRE